jgi:hypothetical protein
MPEPKKAETPGTLTEAVVAVQGEVGTLSKDAVNPHFQSRFTPLDTIVETVGPLLAKNGLTWMAFPTVVDGHQMLRYRLKHVSGESDEDTMPLLNPKGDMQGLGSALTYARRYALCAVLNLVADVDDDGNAAKAPTPSDLARAKSRMNDKAKALLEEAEGLKGDMPKDKYDRYLDSTGYTEEGLQRLVDYLKKQEPADA